MHVVSEKKKNLELMLNGKQNEFNSRALCTFHYFYYISLSISFSLFLLEHTQDGKKGNLRGNKKSFTKLYEIVEELFPCSRYFFYRDNISLNVFRYHKNGKIIE